MTDLTTNQRAALIRAHRNPPFIRPRIVTAQALIDKGYMYEYGPLRPTTGMNVALTAKGKRWNNA
jgi:hypothetical protein